MLRAQTHVMADPAAKPPLQNPKAIELHWRARQPVRSRWLFTT
jgi:hypothetical protein